MLDCKIEMNNVVCFPYEVAVQCGELEFEPTLPPTGRHSNRSPLAPIVRRPQRFTFHFWIFKKH